MQMFHPFASVSTFLTRSGFILALMFALSACDSGNAQVRVTSPTAKRLIQGEPRDASLAQSRRSSEVAPIVPSTVPSATPPTATAVGGVVSPRVSKQLMPAAETIGAVDVRLHPIEGIAAGASQLVTFGIPFPRGSITVADLSKLRVFNSKGIEIPAYVEQLTPWRDEG